MGGGRRRVKYETLRLGHQNFEHHIAFNTDIKGLKESWEERGEGLKMKHLDHGITASMITHKVLTLVTKDLNILP